MYRAGQNDFSLPEFVTPNFIFHTVGKSSLKGHCHGGRGGGGGRGAAYLGQFCAEIIILKN